MRSNGYMRAQRAMIYLRTLIRRSDSIVYGVYARSLFHFTLTYDTTRRSSAGVWGVAEINPFAAQARAKIFGTYHRAKILCGCRGTRQDVEVKRYFVHI